MVWLNDRQVRVMDIVLEEADIRVAELARRLGVSSVTIRSDVEGLVERGIVRHEHGRVLRLPHTDVAGRQAINYRAKVRIARRSALLVQDGSSIMVGGGSTCALFAWEVAIRRQAVHISTNSIFVANCVRHSPNVTITLLGGSYLPSSQVNVGPLVRLCVSDLEAEGLFLGVSGWDETPGFMGTDLFEAEALRTMSERASRCVFLADSSKFRQRGLVPLGIDAADATVVTDGALPRDVRAALKLRGARLVVC